MKYIFCFLVTCAASFSWAQTLVCEFTRFDYATDLLSKNTFKQVIDSTNRGDKTPLLLGKFEDMNAAAWVLKDDEGFVEGLMIGASKGDFMFSTMGEKTAHLRLENPKALTEAYCSLK